MKVNNNNNNKKIDKKLEDVNKNVLNVSGLSATTVLKAKTIEVDNKIPNVVGLIKKQIMMLKYQTLKENISLLLIIIKLQVS